ncbi:uncharacterized protein [Montipora capricornis]|uniref:uncharacterized protein n=1 Tax=Montipora capricornis TaxID=246305 RepID=UPI0035F1335D
MENRSASSALVWLFFVGVFLNIVEITVTSQKVQDIYNRYKKREYGDGTYYGNYPVGRGACTLDPLSPMVTQPGWIGVAAGPEIFQRSLGCGMCLEIEGSGYGSGNNPIVGKKKAVIVDYCASGCGENGLDLFVPGDGRWKISFVAINCPTISGTSDNIQMRFQGSNPWYIKLQARNTKIPTAGIEVLVRGKYHCLTRVPDNFFVGSGLGKLPVRLHVRLTAINGEQISVTIPDITNDISFPSEVQYRGINGASKPSKILCFGQGDKHPYPPGGMRE